MQGDDVDVFFGLLERLGYCARDERVGEAVEAVFAQFVVFCYLLVDGVGSDMGGDGGVEGAVEEGDVGRFWQLVVNCADDGQSACVMSVKERR